MAITLHTEPVETLPEQTDLAEGRYRDEFQLQVDKDVQNLKLATAKAGWPDPDPAKHFHRYVVGADDKAALKAVIRRAATLLRVEPQFYKDAKTEAGHIVVKFHLARKVGKDDKPVPDDTLNADGSPKVPDVPKPGPARK
jgi:hypothetical protein